VSGTDYRLPFTEWRIHYTIVNNIDDDDYRFLCVRYQESLYKMKTKRTSRSWLHCRSAVAIVPRPRANPARLRLERLESTDAEHFNAWALGSITSTVNASSDVSSVAARTTHAVPVYPPKSRIILQYKSHHRQQKWFKWSPTS